MKIRTLIGLCLLLMATTAVAEEDASQSDYWNDGKPEVLLGAFFDEAGLDSILEGEVPDTLVVRLMIWNGGIRGEGYVRALEYSIELPDGLELLRDNLPEYSNMALGKIATGMSQVVHDQDGDGLLINTLTLIRTGDLAYDARIRVKENPESGYLRYVYGMGSPRNVAMRKMWGQDGILNPRVSGLDWKPLRSH